MAATGAIFALLVAGVSTAFTAGSNRVVAGFWALVVIAGLTLSPLFGFRTGERVAIGAHIVWLPTIG